MSVGGLELRLHLDQATEAFALEGLREYTGLVMEFGCVSLFEGFSPYRFLSGIHQTYPACYGRFMSFSGFTSALRTCMRMALLSLLLPALYA